MVALDGDAEEGSEGGLWSFSSVEAKDEIIQIALKMRFSEAVIDAHGPSFGIAKDTMDPGEQDMGCHRTDDLRLVLDVLDPT